MEGNGDVIAVAAAVGVDFALLLDRNMGALLAASASSDDICLGCIDEWRLSSMERSLTISTAPKQEY